MLRICRASFPFRLISGETTILAAMLFVILLSGTLAWGDDWPTFRHDNARSGISQEKLGLDLSLDWVFIPQHPPEVAWPDPNKEKPRTMFDSAYNVAAAGDSVYFASSADNKVYALDAATGEVRWSAFTGGPVRCAPTVSNGMVYVGSDDGYAYCFNAVGGELVWRTRAAFDDKQVIGNQKMISLWPVRTGVLVDNGVAYFAAGVFPHAGIFVCAVDATDGSLIWRNDTCGAEGAEMEFGGISPQGYLLVSENTLYVPSGRAMPAAFDRDDGRFLYYCSPGAKIGGTWALVHDGNVVAGEDVKRIYDEQTGRRDDAEYAWFPGYRLIVTDDYSYLLGFYELRMLDRNAHKYAGEWRKAITAERSLLERKLDKLRRERGGLSGDELEAQDIEIKNTAGQIDALNAQQKRLEDAVHKWRKPLEHHESMILSRDSLLVGGKGAVLVLNPITGEEQLALEVEGKAEGMAVAGGRLYVSTDTGAIYCFSTSGGDAKTVRQPVNDKPYQTDENSGMFAQAASAIVKETGINEGFCLVVGSEDGRLAYELANRTQLRIVGIEPNPEKVAAARSALDNTGLCNRVRFERGDLNDLPYSDYFANLIVSDTMLRTGKPAGAPEEAFRVLKPCGGVLCLGQPGGATDMDTGAVKVWLESPSDSVAPKQVDSDGTWLLLKRGPLPGAGKWTHLYADTANTACSDDELVRGPLGTLWFGEPGPQYMVERHARTASPLAMDGRLFVQGENLVLGYDSYNGVKLWERKIDGAVRNRVDSDMSNLALEDDGLYVAAHDKCLRLEPATGETVRTYQIPIEEGRDSSQLRWGYVACYEDKLYGTVAKRLEQDYGDFWTHHAGTDGEWRNIDDVPNHYRNYLGEYPKPDQRAYWASQQGGLMWRDMTRWPSWGCVDKPEGAVTNRIMAGNAFFARDADNGNLLWTYPDAVIAHPAIAIAGDTVFLADCNITEDEKTAAIEEKKALLAEGIWEDGGELKFEPQHADVRRLVALDAKTGEQRWSRVVDLTGCGGDRMGLAYKDGLLLAYGCFSNHDKNLFRDGKLTWRRITVIDAETGDDVWSKPLNYLRRPLIVRDEIIIEPRACDLYTGEIKTRPHPLTAKESTWEFVRPGHCCSITSASPYMLFLRGYFLWYYDLVKDSGMLPFGAIRPGCWINLIPANGLLLFPEAAAGCTCSYPVRCSVAMKHQPQETTWGIFIQHGDMKPVERMAVNLGAPGDWKDKNGELWFGYPHPKGNSFFSYGMDFDLEEQFLDGTGYISHNFRGLDCKNTDKPWLFASAAQGLAKCTLPLLDNGDDPATYTVRLYFMDTENDKAGVRKFSVSVQGKEVITGLDVVKEADGPDTALVKEFKGTRVTDNLLIDLESNVQNPAPNQAPILNGIEVVREPV